MVNCLINKLKVTAILLCAGKSTRYGKNKNKNFEILKGKSILSYSLRVFNDNDYIDSIVIAVTENEIGVVNKIINQERLSKEVKLVIGGLSRKESVYNCIKNTDAEYVIIHDAARPLITQEYVNKCLENVINYAGVTIGVRTKDTIKITDDNNIVLNTTNRNNTWIIQTPQCFDRKILLDAHKKNKHKEITDDCMLLENNNYTVKILEGNYTNIKITTCEDIKILEQFLS